jgi:hydroxyacylglutathione hydrolase
MKLIALPAFTDNYIWMLHDGRQALVVDPGDAAPVKEALQALQLDLTAILVTHHHPDHTGGLTAWQDCGIPIHGPADDRIRGITHPTSEGDVLHWNGLGFQVLDTPGHTRLHTTYLLPHGLGDSDPHPHLFCGDTLFSAGCGRVFDGSLDQLYDSLMRLASLPDDTRICATHEYTLANLRFAQAVEPRNPDMGRHQAHCEALRARQMPTLPSTLRTERLINPFLRCTQSDVVASALAHGARDADPRSVFVALRQWKNQF